jgi:hypothetical protein
MQDKKADKILTIIINELKNNLGDKVDNICVEECKDEPYTIIGIEFEAYKYFYIRLNYDRGRFGCCIINGSHGISLNSSEEWFDKADLYKFFNDLKEDLEYRIPDKFLIKNKWKK